MNNVISTKVMIFRNVKDYKFEPKLDDNSKQEIVEKVGAVVKGKMSNLTLNQADANVVSVLKTNDLIVGNAQNLFVGKDEHFAINMFEGEHLSIVSTCEGYNKSVVSKAVELSQLLSNKISFAFNDEYGYLMSDISKIGSGIKIESNIMLSAITTINKMDQVKINVAKLGYNLIETKYPAVYTLSTRCNLGLSEKKIFEDFESTLTKLQELEMESAKMLDATKHDELLDKVNRSVAILQVANLLTYDELYNLIVNIRMGLNAGLVQMDIKTINKLQKLVTGKLNNLVSQSELKELAERVKVVLKGEKDV